MDKIKLTYATKVEIKFLDQVLVHGWVNDAIKLWFKREVKLHPQLSIDELSKPRLMELQNVLDAKDTSDLLGWAKFFRDTKKTKEKIK